MADIFQFVPRAELDASGNLRGFIESCRDYITVFGDDLDWNANMWDVTEYVARGGRKGRLAFVFTNFDTAGIRGGEAKPMSQPFLDFAKAYMRHQHVMKQTKSFGGRLVALRALEKALIDASVDGIPRVEKTDPHILNNAMQLIKERTPGSAYQVTNQLKSLAELLVEFQFTNVPFIWKNPINKPGDHNIRVGVKADERRKAKLPSKEALDALAKAYNMAVNPKDVITTSMAALMMCSPDRINELFRLPVNCEYETTYDGKEMYGIRWWASKGAEPMIKWIISSMVDTAKDAIAKLRECTKEARKIALWYENNPDKLYLSSEFEYLRRKERLSTNELVELFGFSSPSGASCWTKGMNIKHEVLVSSREDGNGGFCIHTFAFADIEKAVVSMLPQDFPMYDVTAGLKYSEALILSLKNQFHNSRVTFPNMFEILTTDAFNNQLGSGTQHGKSSLFSRMGLVDANNEPHKITSHQFRHWLNTLAQKKNLDQMTIALWSGRKDVNQNSAYDHRSPEDMLELLKQGDTSVLSGVTVEMAPNVPMTREQYMEMKYPILHTTPYGFCAHDWSMIPCERHRACLDCTEHKCIKGDKNKTERIRQCLEDAEAQLARDEAAVAEGYISVDRWLALNQKRAERLRNLVQIFDDPSIPENTIIELTNENEFSQIRLAVDERQLLGDADAKILGKVRSKRNLQASSGTSIRG